MSDIEKAKEHIKNLANDYKFKWTLYKAVTFSEIGFYYEIIAENDCGFYFHYQISSEALESLPFDKIYYQFDTEMIEHEQNWLYRLFWKMTPSMKKAIVDIMKTQEEKKE